MTTEPVAWRYKSRWMHGTGGREWSEWRVTDYPVGEDPDGDCERVSEPLYLHPAQPVNEELLAALKEIAEGNADPRDQEIARAAILKAEQQSTAPECPKCAEKDAYIKHLYETGKEMQRIDEARIKELEAKLVKLLAVVEAAKGEFDYGVRMRCPVTAQALAALEEHKEG